MGRNCNFVPEAVIRI